MPMAVLSCEFCILVLILSEFLTVRIQTLERTRIDVCRSPFGTHDPEVT
jgi:hypothetical protein